MEKLVILKKMNIRILLSHVGKEFAFYNGRSVDVLRITEEMVGHFFGEYLVTKRLGKIHEKRKNKKNKKGKK